MTDPAKDAVRACYDALGRRDIAAFIALLSPDCVMVEAGGPEILHSGVYRGPGEMAGVFRRLSELSNGTGRFELQELFSNGDGSVVAVHRNLAERPDGRTLDSREALLFDVVDGLVTSVRNFYPDVDEVARFWST